jgi:hypothetical protein
MYATDDWPGAKSQKWSTNKKHYEHIYKDQICLPSVTTDNPPMCKRMIDVPKTGKEIVERSSIRVDSR